jgi:pseudooxynicotine oxidase
MDFITLNNSENMYPKRTADGFIQYSNGAHENGLLTSAVVTSDNTIDSIQYDVIIIGAGFAGLIAARELSIRGRTVLIVEARDRIGGRTFTAQVDNRNFEIGGTWIHWSQPHVWTEVTRYGLTLTESKGSSADRSSILLGNGTKVKEGSAIDFWPAMSKAMKIYSDIDGVHGRTVIPLPHTPLAANEAVRIYDRFSLKDRLDSVCHMLDVTDDSYQMLLAFLSMNMQGDLDEGGFIDHLRWWALGDYDMNSMFDKLGRYKIKQGTSELAQAILNDCHNVKLLLSTPIDSIDRTNTSRVSIRTQTGQMIVGRSVIVTVPLNTLQKIEFLPPLNMDKRDAMREGQCRGGTKIWIKLVTPIGDWFGLAAYPNPITMAYTDDDEGSVIVAFGPHNRLDIQNIDAVEKELRKFLVDVKVQYVLGHDWRNDRFVSGTWSWYKPGQMSSNLLTLQKAEPPIFFASADIANGWRGFIDGAFESGLDCVRHVQAYLNEHST